MIKRDGAFCIPISSDRSCSHCESPPKRFITPSLTGGLSRLYKSLKGNDSSSHDHENELQTDERGRFKPSYPVPLLAGRYNFLQVIGEGQSAVLVAAQDTFHIRKRPVAIKILNSDFWNLGAQESECVQQLNQADPLGVSRTIQLLNTFSFHSHFCMVFEYLKPRPLHKCFQNCQFTSGEEKLTFIKKIAVQLLQVLRFLKRENVIHADLKPENILFENGEEIKIKVVDFGNAIHCVHREVSLYYDQFELQTLLYRAPEVMFGLPFGPEIDMWSVGCILAELYLGEPLFVGQTKDEVLQRIVSLMGSLPRYPFQSGKFYQQYSGYVGPATTEGNASLEVTLMRRLHNMRNFNFASFLAGLLQYKPNRRWTPSRAAVHPFLASDAPLGFFLPANGSQSEGLHNCYYSGIMLTPEQYTFKPHIDNEVKCHHFSTLELLHKGTKSTATPEETSTKSPQVGKVRPLVRRNILASPQPVGQNTVSHESKQDQTNQCTEKLKSLFSLDLVAAEKRDTAEANSVSKTFSCDKSPVINTSLLPGNRTQNNNNTLSREVLMKKDSSINEPMSDSTSSAVTKRVSNTSPLGDSAARVRPYHKRLKKIYQSETTQECLLSDSLDGVPDEQSRTESVVSIRKEELTTYSEQKETQVNTTGSRKQRLGSASPGDTCTSTYDHDDVVLL